MFPGLIALLVLHLLLLALHDIVPMGRWTDFSRLHLDNSARRRWLSALVNGAVGAAPLYFLWKASVSQERMAAKADLRVALYFLAFLFAGELLSWWRFYFLGATPETAARLGRITQGTYTFLPIRNGITVNAFHCVLHVLTLVCLGMTALLLRG